MPSRACLLWRGREGFAETAAAISQGDVVEIVLPENMHHALFAHLYPHARAADASEIDASGDAELLHAVAGLPGLAELDALRDPVRRAGYRVELTSPTPRLVLSPR